MDNKSQNLKETVNDLRNHLQTITGEENGTVINNLKNGLSNKSVEMFNDGFHDHNGPFGDHFKDSPDPFHDTFRDRPE